MNPDQAVGNLQLTPETTQDKLVTLPVTEVSAEPDTLAATPVVLEAVEVPEGASPEMVGTMEQPDDAEVVVVDAVEEQPEEPEIADTPTPPEDSGIPELAESTDDGAITKRLDEHDSLVTVRLSEPPILTIDTMAAENDYDPDTPVATTSQRATMPTLSEADELDDTVDPDVDWEQLQRTEDEESSGQGVENTAMLLARLEQENAKLATNPKSVKVHGPEPSPSAARRPRPPSMAQLRDMVHGPTPPALRYSMLPPPPMTDLEFYAALVQDYHQTAARLPLLLANKIRKGIPPPLRGVVWQGITGAARDTVLAGRFDRFCVATSPYEGIIGKDLGRSFPGVEMFRDPDGDGQRMLGRVLKSYSLHDRRIGYCQGLAFLVGPLLMHMPDREAFCVLVKLMEDYDLRSSYTPDLAGLHMRIYQFRELLRAALPDLSSHLEDLQVDPAGYVSQWFLSFFAVTCPLPMLFRMFDVVFAEGAAETMMRVALSLMQKNHERLLACVELEDAMQLLLSRGLWDCYHYNADEFVQHFLAQSSVVSRDRLASLEQAYREAQIAASNQTDNANVDRSSAIATAASRFLGRLWVSSSASFSLSSPPTATTATFPSSFLSSSSAAPTNASDPASPPAPNTTPGSNQSAGLSASLSAAPLRPLSMLRRSTSKQSLASTVNSMEAASSATQSSSSSTSSASSVLSSTSTEATSLSRDSSGELNVKTNNASQGSGAGNSIIGSKQSDNERYLNSQIEDLLTALSDLQRQHALLADQLQNEKEDRDEDRKMACALLRSLRKAIPARTDIESEGNENSPDTPRDLSHEEIASLLEPMDARFGSASEDRRSSIQQTKAQLRDELARAKEQLANELAKGRDLNRREYDLEQEVVNVKDQLRDSHTHVRSLHQDKQRLERLVHDLRTRSRSNSTTAASTTGRANAASAGTNGATNGATNGSSTAAAESSSDRFGRTAGSGVGASTSGGLRELKLGRSKSTPANVPSSSLGVRGGQREPSFGSLAAIDNGGFEQQEALVLELVQAKTAEAVARQEAEEVKQKFESLRKALGLSLGDMTSLLQNGGGAATASASTTAKGVLGRLTNSTSESSSGTGKIVPASTPAPTATGAAASSSGYSSFFGWRR